MAEKQDNTLTAVGQVMLYACVAIGIVVSIVVMSALGYSGAVPGAIFGGIGGGAGGVLGFGLAYLSGNVKPKEKEQD